MSVLGAAALMATLATPRSPPSPAVYDVAVFGATPGGIMAAIGARRANVSTASGLHLSVVLVVNGTHVGGFTSGGHCGCDMYQDWVFGGLAREFWDRVHLHYGANNPNAGSPACRSLNSTGGYCKYTHEPHVAEAIFRSMLEEAGVTLVNASHGIRSVDVSADTPPRITHVTTESGVEIAARVWVDGSYEGELIVATPNVRWTKGREARTEFNESLAGVLRNVDDVKLATPFRVFPTNPGIDATVGGDDEGFPRDVTAPVRFLPNVFPQPPSETEGQADGAVMAFEFRPCLTNIAANRVDIDAPIGYNASNYELVRRAIASGHVKVAMGGTPFQNGKISPDIAGPIAFALPHGGWDYPGANASTRNRVWDNHLTWWMGLFHFLRTDDSIPLNTRNQVAGYGLCKDEHVDANPPHWPPQLYVRESVRLRGDVILTQNDVVGTTTTKHSSIGLGSWFVDLHTAERVGLKTNGSIPAQPSYIVQNMGAVGQVGERRFWIFEIPFEVLLPRRTDVANLLVPVCISATRVAFSVFRLETQYMIAGHAAGIAAAMAVAGDLAVHDVDVRLLQDVLVCQGQVLHHNTTLS